MPPACDLCALPLTVIQSDVCGPCLIRPPPWRHMISAFPYDSPVDGLLHKFKYVGDLTAGLALAHLMAQCLGQHMRDTLTHRSIDVLVPMPLHWRRRWHRGFNPSQELGRHLARWLDIPMSPDACARTRHTTEQARLDHGKRLKNVSGAFLASPAVKGLHVVLLDDVMTTGATAKAATTALLAAGARCVDVWTCARVVKPGGGTGIR